MDAAPDEHLPRLEGLWRQIAARYKDRSAAVVFELLNEPHDKLTDAKWNAAVPRLLAAVRATNPTRPVIVGPTSWNAIRALDKLEFPETDRNLILTVHYYDPFQFTHQGASWVKGSDKWKGKKWSGTETEQAEIRKALAKAAAWAKPMIVPSSWANSPPIKEPTWNRAAAGQASSPAKRSAPALAGRTGNSARASERTIRKRICGASR